MSTLAEIESAIRDLPEPEFWELAEWFDALKADAWDARLEADAKAGRLEGAAQQALADFRAGLTRPLIIRNTTPCCAGNE